MHRKGGTKQHLFSNVRTHPRALFLFLLKKEKNNVLLMRAGREKKKNTKTNAYLTERHQSLAVLFFTRMNMERERGKRFCEYSPPIFMFLLHCFVLFFNLSSAIEHKQGKEKKKKYHLVSLVRDSMAKKKRFRAKRELELSSPQHYLPIP